MPIYIGNSIDVFIKNLRLAEDDSEITTGTVLASVYDQTQFQRILDGMPGTPITGASNISMTYRAASETPGHWRGSFASTVGLSVGTRVWVNYVGSLGFNVWREEIVRRRVVT